MIDHLWLAPRAAAACILHDEVLCCTQYTDSCSLLSHVNDTQAKQQFSPFFLHVPNRVTLLFVFQTKILIFA